MMKALAASVIVTSHGQPGALLRCVEALRLSDHPVMEVVVVACEAGLAALRQGRTLARLKVVPWGGCTLAQARNLGVRAAAGEVVALLDGAAVAEPVWLTRLLANFADPRVEAATGFVRGPCGMVLRHRAAWVDGEGVERPLAADPRAASLHQGAPGAGVRLWSAGLAVRRETLAALGGFDPALADAAPLDRDLSLRLAAEELIVAVVPLAQVQVNVPVRARPHLGSQARGADHAVFLRKHAPDSDPVAARAALAAAERRRALRAMVDGWIEPRDVHRSIGALEAGFALGLGAEIPPLLPIATPTDPFLPLPDTGARPARTLAGWSWSARRLRRAAAAACEGGAVVSVLRLSPLPWRRRMQFTAAGHWLQTGGIWTRPSEPDAGPAPGLRPRNRLRAEVTRLAAVRPVDTLLG